LLSDVLVLVGLGGDAGKKRTAVLASSKFTSVARACSRHATSMA